jgi:hydroxyethylthiazole kinase-like uncharacterized protein yjeF
MLAGLGALRVGAGVLMLAVAESVAAQVAVAVPESGVTGLPESPDGSVLGSAAAVLAGRLERADAVLVGPGLDDPDEAAALLGGLGDLSAPVVLDAYALGAVREGAFAGSLVLTPNVNEGARLLGKDPDELSDVAAAAQEIARRYGAVVSLHNVVAAEASMWTVPSGHAGLGTSGSGDVLAGAVLGLLGRGADLDQAACWGTYLHAVAGDRLAARIGRLGFLAREVLDELPLVLSELRA